MKMLSVLLVLFAIPAFATPTALTVQELNETVYDVSLTAADQTNGNSVVNMSGDVFFLIKSTAGTSVVTFTPSNTPVTVPGYGPLTKSSKVVTITVGNEAMIGPFNTRAWNDSAGKLQITYAAVGTASTTIKALRLDPDLRN